ncbi:MAG: hypothetical protein CMQ43_03665 [Gammaproteobacteria bacterium]|nr:hypothetical protein [Gammaproteobacteria bacterium]MBK79998.1 hypothetical protein [Gammaproteobacteria bacterium]
MISASLLLSVVERHFREQDVERLSVALDAIARLAETGAGDLRPALSGAISGVGHALAGEE